MNAPAYRTWIEVSRSALLWNFGQFQRFFGNQAQIAPVIKANAYGHGAPWVIKTLKQRQIWGFCVAYGQEALALKPLFNKHRLLVLSAWQPSELPSLIAASTHLVVWDNTSAKLVDTAARRLGRRANVHLKIDTGTSRIGVRPEGVPSTMKFLQTQRWLHVAGIFSHYADSESANLGFARQQRQRFIQSSKPYAVPFRHIACTAASLRLPLDQTNFVRLGIGLYGLWPSPATARANRVILKPVLSWKTRVLQVKRVPFGTTVGYNRTYRVRRDTRLAVLPIGYADGYDRRASNASWVVINGRRCPVRGRISMNLTIVDVGATTAVRPGMVATMIGKGVVATDLAQSWKTLNYEVVSRLHPAIPRIETT